MLHAHWRESRKRYARRVSEQELDFFVPHCLCLVSPVHSGWFSQNLLRMGIKGERFSSHISYSFGLGQTLNFFVLQYPTNKIASKIFF